MNAVERVCEYARIPIEEQSANIELPAAWPTEGRIEVCHDPDTCGFCEIYTSLCGIDLQEYLQFVEM